LVKKKEEKERKR